MVSSKHVFLRGFFFRWKEKVTGVPSKKVSKYTNPNYKVCELDHFGALAFRVWTENILNQIRVAKSRKINTGVHIPTQEVTLQFE